MFPIDRNTLLLVQRTLIAEQARITAALAEVEMLLEKRRPGRPPGGQNKKPPTQTIYQQPATKKTISPAHVRAMLAGRKRAANARARAAQKAMTA